MLHKQVMACPRMYLSGEDDYGEYDLNDFVIHKQVMAFPVPEREMIMENKMLMILYCTNR